MDSDYQQKIKSIVLQLFDLGGLKLGGEYKLKSGLTSPIYIDLRIIVSFPKLLAEISDALWDLVKDLKFDNICGVPYTALPIATVMSIKQDRPMVMRRKEVKKYGTGKIIEGVFKEGETTLVVEDLVTSGLSVLETVQPLNDVGLKVSDIVVLVDRQQGGQQNLQNNNLNLHALLEMKNLLQILLTEGRITQEIVDNVTNYIKNNQSVIPKKQQDGEVEKKAAVVDWSFQKRLENSANELQKDLYKIMIEKKTNLSVAVDLTKSQEILDLVEKIGEHICVLKTHVDVVEDYSEEFVQKLADAAKRFNFLLFEDRKFADIGNTVSLQYSSGVYKIADWAHIVNAHSTPGEGIIQGLAKAGLPKKRGLLMLAQMSSKGNLMDQEYAKKTVEMSQKNKEFVIGFISQERISGPEFLYMTPGVNLSTKSDGLQQQYNTPEYVIKEKGTDIIIVGRGIYQSENPAESAISYKEAAWKSYLERCEGTR